MGRRTYEFSAIGGWWGDAGPLGQTPCFVLSHHLPTKVHAPHIFSFVTTGIQDALASAKLAAGDNVIGVMGANVQQQFLNAGAGGRISYQLGASTIGCWQALI